MIKIIEPNQELDDFSLDVFLAGAVSGTKPWHKEFIEYLSKIDTNKRLQIITPLAISHNKEIKHEDQFEWERKTMLRSRIMSFYIPNPDDSKILNNGGYAQTTRFELGMYLGEFKKLIVFIGDKVKGREYLLYHINNSRKNNEKSIITENKEHHLEVLKKEIIKSL